MVIVSPYLDVLKPISNNCSHLSKCEHDQRFPANSSNGSPA
ncbi:hypothetical protein [Rubritalea tangerina]